MASPHSQARLSRICLRTLPLHGGRRHIHPASAAAIALSSCPSFPVSASASTTTTGTSSRSSNSRRHSSSATASGLTTPTTTKPSLRRHGRCFSTTPQAAKSVGATMKKVKREFKAPSKPQYGTEEVADEPVDPESVVRDIASTMHPRDIVDVARMSTALERRAAAARGHRSTDELQTEAPAHTVLDDVREMAGKLELASETERLDHIFDKLSADDKPDPRSFWFDEDDPETITEDSDPLPDTVDMPETAHIKLQEMREMRHWARVAAWEMPLLAQFAQEFEPPGEDKVLRFRYTTYMGDFHAAESKVVVEFSPDDLPLTDAQKLKLKKLVGPRYNPDKDMVRMSCESYEEQAQNKRFLSDLVDKIIDMARDPTDMFEDIPLDLRHHKVPKKPVFPKEWLLTRERKAELEAFRERTQFLDGARMDTGLLVDGSSRERSVHAMSLEVDRTIRSFLAGKVYKRLDVGQKKA